jgi:hypothetical protein
MRFIATHASPIVPGPHSQCPCRLFRQSKRVSGEPRCLHRPHARPGPGMRRPSRTVDSLTQRKPARRVGWPRWTLLQRGPRVRVANIKPGLRCAWESYARRTPCFVGPCVSPGMAVPPGGLIVWMEFAPTRADVVRRVCYPQATRRRGAGEEWAGASTEPKPWRSGPQGGRAVGRKSPGRSPAVGAIEDAVRLGSACRASGHLPAGLMPSLAEMRASSASSEIPWKS